MVIASPESKYVNKVNTMKKINPENIELRTNIL